MSSKSLLACFAIFLACIFASSHALAFVDIAANSNATYSLAPHEEVLEDPTTELSFEAVQSSSKFKPNGDSHPVPGYTKSVWWLRFSLKNSSAEELSRYLEFADSAEGIPQLTFYTVQSDGAVATYEYGGEVRQSDKLFNHRFAVLPIAVPSNSALTVYIRAQGDSIKMPLYLHTLDGLYNYNQQSMLWIGLVLGFLLVLLPSAISMYISTRDKSYISFAGFIVGLILTLAAFDGLVGEFLFPNARFFHMRTVNIASSFSIACLVLFVTEFLQLSKHWRRTARMARGFAWFAFGVAALNFVYKQNLLVNLTVVAGAGTCLTISVAAVLSNLPFARINALPIFALLIAVIITSLKQATILPATFLTSEALRLGGMSMALLWAAALAFRVRQLTASQNSSLMNALELENLAIKNRAAGLQGLLKIVTDISDKLNSPLLMLIHVFERIFDKANDASVDDLLNPSSQTSESVKLFLATWTKVQSNMAHSIRELRTLSQELANLREEHLEKSQAFLKDRIDAKS